MTEWQGTWNAGLDYTPGEVVGYAGTTWVALEANTGQAPQPGPYWEPQAVETGPLILPVPVSQGGTGQTSLTDTQLLAAQYAQRTFAV